MIYSNLKEEKNLWKQGRKHVIGLDEVGRGSLAGPVVAAAVSLDYLKLKNLKLIKNWKLEIENLKIRDSKQLSADAREKYYEILTRHKNIKWGVGIVSEKIIDKINILEATKMAMVKAVEDLIYKPQFLIKGSRYNLGQVKDQRTKTLKQKFLLIDGNFRIDTKIDQMSIIKGDEKVFSIAAASIIAKVTRDRIMEKMDEKYPRYGFKNHKGYGTNLHIKNLETFGPCKIHRKSFEPIKKS